ncbi:hypothetical protein OCK74_01230 [Chitinophagaceae bacterium LB-8]|uniref:Uncharacterized protein n=1 Tax=Paraflavisolibacter caeni TaxID=2982496 RepID=A0A9X2XS92_9BACT|nr:hypothetical protein [Paraflavisolibacter caeni]MCU7547710.1 hypothetical protein [Paraflavisolibacter caeni]
METTTPYNTKENNIDLWEAWIDMQNSGKNQRGTLYIIGDVVINNRILRPFLVKKEAVHPTKDELLLEVIPHIISENGYTVEVFYSEELQSPNQYKSITIYSGNIQIAKITEIEVLL